MLHNLPSSVLDLYEDWALRATQNAAVACHEWAGAGCSTEADQAAVDAMRSLLAGAPISGCVAIGEGERDRAPMLYIGEKLGGGGIPTDIAVDPLEGTNLCAHNVEGAISVVALAPRNSLLAAPDVYMQKLAVGPNIPMGVIDLNLDARQNIMNICDAVGIAPSALSVVVLNRARHHTLMQDIKQTGARLHTIEDGDVMAIIECALQQQEYRIYMGDGGAPEGVLAAAALKCLGGQMQGRLRLNNNDEQARASKLGITDFSRIYSIKDLVQQQVILALTAITNNSIIKGIQQVDALYTTHSLVLRSDAGMVSVIKSAPLEYWQTT